MSCFNNIYKKIINQKEKNIFFLLLFLTFHFYNYKNNEKVFFNTIFQIILQLIFFLKIKNVEQKTHIYILLFLFFTIFILLKGITWIMYNLKK